MRVAYSSSERWSFHKIKNTALTVSTIKAIANVPMTFTTRGPMENNGIVKTEKSKAMAPMIKKGRTPLSKVRTFLPTKDNADGLFPIELILLVLVIKLPNLI